MHALCTFDALIIFTEYITLTYKNDVDSGPVSIINIAIATFVVVIFVAIVLPCKLICNRLRKACSNLSK